jgi:lysophospholipase L1-like esterase
MDQVVSHAAEWERRGADVLAGGPAGPPLWVVLGDSVAQGVGVPRVEDGLVGRVQRLLERRDGAPWRVLNLSRSGAVVADLLQVQVPRLRELQAQGWRPELVTAVVGGNDLRRTPLPRLLEAVPALVAAVPAGTVLGTLPQGIRPPRARAANALLLRLAAERGLPVVDVWGATGPPWRGKYADGLHPNALGLADWVRAFAVALDLPPEEPAVSAR